MKKERSAEEGRYNQPVFYKGRIMYVPDYKLEGQYREPGTDILYTQAELKARGAKQSRYPLWKRKWLVHEK